MTDPREEAERFLNRAANWFKFVPAEKVSETATLIARGWADLALIDSYTTEFLNDNEGENHE